MARTKVSEIGFDQTAQVFGFALEVVGETYCSICCLVADFDVPDGCDMVSVVALDLLTFGDLTLVESRAGQIVLREVRDLPDVTGFCRIRDIGTIE